MNNSLFSYQKKIKMKNLIQLPISKFNLLGLFAIISLCGLFAFSNANRSTPTASVAADKMNVFYIGIDNPITVAMAGVPTDKVRVSCDNVTIENLGDGHYNVRVKETGDKIIKVTDGTYTQEITYRVKRIPDPETRIGKTAGGSMRLWDFQQQKGLHATLYYFPLVEQCVINGFEMTKQSKDSDPINVTNQGADFSKESQQLVDEAKVGDVFYFDSVRCKCPGDPAGRKINSVVVKIR